MNKNYLFQNYNYVDYPVNMKHVILDLLRRYNICIHMRDMPNCIYDLDKFLSENNSMGIPYHKDNIIDCKKKIKENEERLVLLDSPEWVNKMYKSYYDDGLKEFNNLMKTNNINQEYRQKAEKYKNRQELIQNFITNFNIDGEEEMTQVIKQGLDGCVEALQEDYNYYNNCAIENDVTLKPNLTYSPMGKDEWTKKEKEKAIHAIDFCKNQIKEEEKIIEELREKDTVIKKIFKALEPFDKEIE